MRVVTPGTLTDTELLNDKAEAILLAVHQGSRHRLGLAWLSLTQGALHLAECAGDELETWVARIGPSELLFSADVTPTFEQRLKGLRLASHISLTQRPEWQFDAGLGLRKLLEQLNSATLAAWGAEELTHAHAAAAALLGYAEHTQGRALSHVQSLEVQRDDVLIDLPVTTRRNLELVQTLRGEDAPTLFSLLDTCMTGMGSRMLKCWLLEPRRERTPGAAAAGSHRLPARRAVAGAARRAQGLQRRRAHHRPHRAAPGAAARAGGPAPFAGQGGAAVAATGRARLAAGRDHRQPGAAGRLRRGAGARHPGGTGGADPRRRRDRGRARCRARRAARHPGPLRHLPAGPGNPREGAHRHRQPARAVQQGARLLHRGHAGPAGQGAGRLPAAPDPEERRALHHAGAQGLRGQGAVGAGPRAGAREDAVRPVARPVAGLRARAHPPGPRAGGAWTRCARWPSARSRCPGAGRSS